MDKLLQSALALAGKVGAVTGEVLARHIQRGDVVQATWLALVSGRPAFFLGSPGVDKTGTVQSLAARIEGASFFDVLMPTVVSVEQLLVESTSIEELPLPDGGRQIRTRDTLGRAASAHVLFADEIWKAEPRVLQTLIDLAKGDGVRHEGQMMKTPLMAFLAASNELPEAEGNLGAVWSRMTIRVQVQPLDRLGKSQLVAARLAGSRERAAGKAAPAERLTLDQVRLLRQARPFVEIPADLVETVLDILQELVAAEDADFAWAWADDRRFGRLFDIMQAHALLQGRTTVGKSDLGVLEWLLWDTPEQIAVLKAKLGPYTRTPASEAREAVDALLAPGGTVTTVLSGDRARGVQAIQQADSCLEELARLKAEAAKESPATVAEIAGLHSQVTAVKADVVRVILGQPPKKPPPAA